MGREGARDEKRRLEKEMNLLVAAAAALRSQQHGYGGCFSIHLYLQ
jgi:hypothetical protein